VIFSWAEYDKERTRDIWTPLYIHRLTQKRYLAFTSVRVRDVFTKIEYGFWLRRLQCFTVVLLSSLQGFEICQTRCMIPRMACFQEYLFRIPFWIVCRVWNALVFSVIPIKISRTENVSSIEHLNDIFLLRDRLILTSYFHFVADEWLTLTFPIRESQVVISIRESVVLAGVFGCSQFIHANAR
jgi:hypothetical protein